MYPGGQPEVVHGLGGGGQVGHALVQEPEHGGSVPHKPDHWVDPSTGLREISQCLEKA